MCGYNFKILTSRVKAIKMNVPKKKLTHRYISKSKTNNMLTNENFDQFYFLFCIV